MQNDTDLLLGKKPKGAATSSAAPADGNAAGGSGRDKAAGGPLVRCAVLCVMLCRVLCAVVCGVCWSPLSLCCSYPARLVRHHA